MKKQVKPEKSIIFFQTPREWEKWLSKNHDKSDGVWLKIFKKASNEKSINYAQALDEALCYGWIDGQVNSLDEKAYLQKFTPRRSKSAWSKINTGHVARLAKLGKMRPAGLLEVARAKADGRWANAAEPPSLRPHHKMPEFMSKALKDSLLIDSYNERPPYQKNDYIYWIASAKQEETRQKRLNQMLAELKKGDVYMKMPWRKKGKSLTKNPS